MGKIIEFVLAILLEWLFTLAIIYIIFMCFELDFSMRIGTGIWLILMLTKSLFKQNGKTITLKCEE